MTQYRTRLTLNGSARANDRVRLRNRRARNRIPFKPFYMLDATGTPVSTPGFNTTETLDVILSATGYAGVTIHLAVNGVPSLAIPTDGTTLTVAIAANDVLTLQKQGIGVTKAYTEVTARSVQGDILFRSRLEFV